MSGALLVPQTGLLGGAERVLLDWGRALDPPVLVACPPGPLADAAAEAGLTVLTLRERPLQRRGRTGRAALGLAGLAREIATLARRHRPAAVVASGRRPILAGVSTPLAGARLIAVHHDLPPGPPLGPLLRAAGRRAAAVVATSAAADPGGAAVVHPGVDRAHWALPDPPAGGPRALCLGALVPSKRLDLALEIAARVPELALDVAGAPLSGDPFPARLSARAQRPDLAGRVRFLGALADPRPALAAAHCLLHCGEREAFGLALVEALAAGRPVVAAATGGPLEIVTPACGRLYAPGDPDAGAAALRAVLAEPGLRAGARERAAAFDGDAAARRFAAIVRAAAQRS